MRIVLNKEQGEVVLHFTANGSVTVVGNTSVSNIAFSNNETVTGAYITQVFWGTGNGAAASADAYWEIKRGSNTVLILDQSGSFDFAGNGTALKLDTAGTLVANLVNTDAGFLMIELQKLSDVANNQYLRG